MFLLKPCMAICLLLTGSCCLKAQQQAHDYLGTKTTYHPLQTKHTSPPQGFKPVFINYVGRHGARFMTKPGSDVMVLDVLQQAENLHALTPTGTQILQAALAFEEAERDNYENITLLGADEQRGVAERMYKEYSSVFKNNDVDVLMTTKVRTQQSANAFLAGFPSDKITTFHRAIIADSADAILRFYDMSPAYALFKKSKAIQQHTDSLQNDTRTSSVGDEICNKLFTSVFLQQLKAGALIADDGSGKKMRVSLNNFVKALYEVYAIAFSVVKEVEQKHPFQTANDFAKAFTASDLQWLSLLNDADDFYAKGPAEDTLGIQVTIAAPLLQNFINTTDSVVEKSKSADAILRFTHAEAISPFATLLGIPQASQTSNSAYTFQEHWQASQIIPLSANIQWILYSDGKSDLVKVLLNEKEVALPVVTASFPYYNWQTVKQYYVEKLSRLGVSLQSNMPEFLKRN